MLYFDHILVTSENPELTATTLSEILGVSPPTPEGRDNDMFRVDLEQGSFILFLKPRAKFNFVILLCGSMQKNFQTSLQI